MSLQHVLQMVAAGCEGCGRGEPEIIELPGWTLRVRVKASQTAGRFALLEAWMVAGHPGSLEHTHSGHDETVTVISGTLELRVGNSYRKVAAGESVFLARGEPHGLSNPSAHEAGFLMVVNPAGYEECFAKVATLSRQGSLTGSDIDVVRIMADHGTYLASPISSLGND